MLKTNAAFIDRNQWPIQFQTDPTTLEHLIQTVIQMNPDGPVGIFYVDGVWCCDAGDINVVGQSLRDVLYGVAYQGSD